MPDIQRFTRKLPCKLKPEEIQARKETLVDTDREINAALAKKATAMADFNGSLKDLRQKQRALLDDISNGTETREVDCWQEPDFPTNRMVTYRADTRDQIEERALTADERQASMFDANKPKKTPEPEGGKIINLPPGQRPKKRKGATAEEPAPEARAADGATDGAELPETPGMTALPQSPDADGNVLEAPALPDGETREEVTAQGAAAELGGE